jgi:hypothetical protein
MPLTRMNSKDTAPQSFMLETSTLQRLGNFHQHPSETWEDTSIVSNGDTDAYSLSSMVSVGSSVQVIVLSNCTLYLTESKETFRCLLVMPPIFSGILELETSF